MVPFLVTTRLEADYVVVTVTGAVDALTAPTYNQKLIAALEQSPRVICDLGTVDFFDSTGLSALVDARNNALACDGSVELICSRPSMLRLFTITGLDGLFTIHSSINDVANGVAVST